MNSWNALTIIDWILFAFATLTILYLLIFTISSFFYRHTNIANARQQNRFIVLIPSYKHDKTIEQTVKSVLGQTYPQRLFDVTVVSIEQNEITNFRLAQLPITLLTPQYAKSTKAKALQVAINNLPQFKIYDAVIVLDADNIVEPEFLEQVNNAYESAGTKAIQVHRLSRNRDTTTARLEAIFEEINNTIFFKGQVALGFSSSLAGSGMVFDFSWFKQNIIKINSSMDVKELESLLMKQHVYIDYFDHIFVYDEKTRQVETFNAKRRSWILSQIKTLLRNIRHLPLAAFNRDYATINKILQWMLIPRMLLMAIVILFCIVAPFVYMTSALKWWGLFALSLLVYALATPDYLVDDKWDKTFYKVPLIFLKSIPGISKLVDKYELLIKSIHHKS